MTTQPPAGDSEILRELEYLAQYPNQPLMSSRITLPLRAASHITALRAELAASRLTAEYWKAEHNAGNTELAAVRVERDAAIQSLREIRDSTYRSSITLRGMADRAIVAAIAKGNT